MNDARFHFLIGVLPLLGAALALAGCKSSAKGSSSADDEYPTSRPAPLNMQEQTIPLAQSSVAVAQGPTPLVFIFNNSASIRVVDLTSGQQLAAVHVQPRTLVRVDDAKVSTPADISNHLRGLRGRSVSMVVVRDRKEINVMLSAMTRPERSVGALWQLTQPAVE